MLSYWWRKGGGVDYGGQARLFGIFFQGLTYNIKVSIYSLDNQPCKQYKNQHMIKVKQYKY